jgi:hypothetical protein
MVTRSLPSPEAISIQRTHRPNDAQFKQVVSITDFPVRLSVTEIAGNQIFAIKAEFFALPEFATR